MSLLHMLNARNALQVRVPETGGRLCIASDGLWDAFENLNRVTKLWRPWDTEACPRALFYLQVCVEACQVLTVHSKVCLVRSTTVSGVHV